MYAGLKKYKRNQLKGSGTYILDSVKKLFGQLLLAARLIELRKIQGSEVRPVHYIDVSHETQYVNNNCAVSVSTSG